MIDERIKKLGLTIPDMPAPAAMYVPVAQTGNLLFVSGQLPKKDGVLMTGKLGAEHPLAEGQEAAKYCAINIIAALKGYLGDLDKVKRIVKLQAFVSSDLGFTDQHLVTNGASQLLFDVFGEAGRHARTAVSVNQLPMDAMVEIEAIVEIAD